MQVFCTGVHPPRTTSFKLSKLEIAASPTLGLIDAYQGGVRSLQSLSQLMQSTSSNLIALKKLNTQLEYRSLLGQKKAGLNAGSGSVSLAALAPGFPDFFRGSYLNFNKAAAVCGENESEANEHYWFRFSQGQFEGVVFNTQKLFSEEIGSDAVMRLSGDLSNNDSYGQAFSKGLQGQSQTDQQQLNNLYANLSNLADTQLSLMRSIWSGAI